jgi:hypothetical protein
MRYKFVNRWADKGYAYPYHVVDTETGQSVYWGDIKSLALQHADELNEAEPSAIEHNIELGYN